MGSVITPVYGGRATITFKEGSHVYTVDVPSKGIRDLWQPSVTGIIRVLSKADVLIPWALGEMISRVKLTLESNGGPFSKELVIAVLEASKSAHNDRKQQAGDIGTYVHNFLEGELKSRAGLQPAPVFPYDMPAEYAVPVSNSIDAGLKFFDEHEIKLVQAESPRWSPTHGFIGTGDLIAEVDGELTVVDYKTSKRLYDTVFLQLAAYQAAYEEEFPGQRITRRLAINVGKDGKLVTEDRDNATLERDFKCFLSLLDAWRWDRENQGQYSKPAPPVVGAL
jgi:CRISPR/Cas system-associated exonuclease Cas4 (RecB family)